MSTISFPRFGWGMIIAGLAILFGQRRSSRVPEVRDLEIVTPARQEIRNYRYHVRQKGGQDLVISVLAFKSLKNPSEVVMEMEKIGLRPATIHELLALGCQYPASVRMHPIVALGSDLDLRPGNCYVPFLYHSGTDENLVGWSNENWKPDWVFAAVSL